MLLRYYQAKAKAQSGGIDLEDVDPEQLARAIGA